MEQRSEHSDRELVFDWSDWASCFPELESYFRPENVRKIAERAAMYFNPGKNSAVSCVKERRILLYLLVSHLVFLQKKTESNDQIMGPIKSVSEGSISLSVDTSGSTSGKIDPWLAQSRYGYEFWALSKKYRSTFYIRPIPDPRYRIFP
ncbi:DUF4054 domain-containing protein [Commensalibacter oyaizuii]|uniref:DUF4054 domain-containing protein n=1 Tax=Commensalibacter oyaizuii TaxID=3043873 RepID=A0ABT6Q3K9_9PROT|nr:DUF4054 domain-containing protein [Commensalibacter sp. TBRC 16381]MDI2091677.1 DUF4054 domain-containing protein [Commensalibacter sp. TBRC 16381]